MSDTPTYDELFAMVQDLPEMICGFLPDGTITYVNRAYLEFFRKTADELIGANFLSLVPAPGRDTVMDNIRSLTPATPKLSHEHQVIGPDNDVRWQSWTNQAIFDETGRPVRYLAIGKDITHRKQTLEALQSSETKYRSMMEAMTDAVYICSPDFTIEYLNPAMLRRLGRDAVGEPCHGAMHDLNQRCTWCVFDRIQKGDSLDTTIISPKDNRTYRMTHMPIRNPDGSISKMTIYRDITEYLNAVRDKEKAKARLQQSQKMEAIGTLAGGIAHDFNNILTAIIGYAQLLEQETDPMTQAAEDLKEIMVAGRRARDLISQILTFARQSDADRSLIRVDLIAKEVLQLIRSTIPTTIKIKSRVQSKRKILGNPAQVHQIFMNLFTNAAFAMEEAGGVLELRIRDLSLDKGAAPGDPAPGQYQEIVVSDTGTGIPEEHIKSIFEPYFTTKPQGEGTGMGLAVVHGIVSKYGGRISVKSLPGRGTAFTIRLPVAGEEASPFEPAAESADGGKETIMVVDDEAAVTKLSCRMLERMGYTVKGFTSSRDALALFAEMPQAFDLVITDMTMPEITGDRLARELMAVRPDIPVILCTGYSKKMSGKKAAEMGIKYFVRKPVDFTKLAGLIRQALDRNRPEPTVT